MDDIRIYDTALDATGIAALMNETTPVVGAGDLVARYGFDDGLAPLVNSATAGTANHDGVNNGAVWRDSYQGRSGVMQFSSGLISVSGEYAIAAHPDFNVPQGALTFLMKSAGNVGPGNDGAILFDRRTTNGDVVVLNNRWHTFRAGQLDGWHGRQFVLDADERCRRPVASRRVCVRSNRRRQDADLHRRRAVRGKDHGWALGVGSG